MANLRPTWGQLVPTWAQLGANLESGIKLIVEIIQTSDLTDLRIRLDCNDFNLVLELCPIENNFGIGVFSTDRILKLKTPEDELLRIYSVEIRSALMFVVYQCPAFTGFYRVFARKVEKPPVFIAFLRICGSKLGPSWGREASVELLLASCWLQLGP